MLIDEKTILKSKTIWGAIIAFVPAATEIVSSVLGSGVLPPKVAAAVSGFGALLAFLGRIGAKTKIK